MDEETLVDSQESRNLDAGFSILDARQSKIGIRKSSMAPVNSQGFSMLGTRCLSLVNSQWSIVNERGYEMNRRARGAIVDSR